MKHRILIKVPALLLVLAMLLSLCACAVNPQELLEQLELPQLGGKGEESWAARGRNPKRNPRRSPPPVRAQPPVRAPEPGTPQWRLPPKQAAARA